MVAGLPGSGIGGFFFLLTALLMPVVELGRTLRGRSSLQRWGFVLKHTGIAIGVLGAMWATGWAIGLGLFALTRHTKSTATAALLQPNNFLQTPPVLISMAMLLIVLLGVEGLRLAFARQPASPRR